MSKLLGIKELCEFWQAIKSSLTLKQDKLTAGQNITINGNTISSANTWQQNTASADVDVGAVGGSLLYCKNFS